MNKQKKLTHFSDKLPTSGGSVAKKDKSLILKEVKQLQRCTYL